jgi:hemerythrin-like domain-containing protein
MAQPLDLASNDADVFVALDATHQQMVVHLKLLADLMARLDERSAEAQNAADAHTIEAFFSSVGQGHHHDEETRVFPPLLIGPDAALAAAVRTLQTDHGWIEEDWLILAPQLRALAGGQHDFDRAEFLHAAEIYIELMTSHMALEESLVYPEAKAHAARHQQGRARRLAAA